MNTLKTLTAAAALMLAAGAAQADDYDKLIANGVAHMNQSVREGGPVIDGMVSALIGRNWSGAVYPTVTLSEPVKNCLKDHFLNSLLGPKELQGPIATKNMTLACGASTDAQEFAAGVFLGSDEMTSEAGAYLEKHGGR
jgi:hypothetical protein